MVTIYINLKYLRANQRNSGLREKSVSLFSLFPYGIFVSLFTKCALQYDLYSHKIRELTLLCLKEEK
jgi:hypothetical protein